MPYRSAISGQYVKEKVAKKHPDNTVFEKPVKPKPTNPTKPRK